MKKALILVFLIITLAGIITLFVQQRLPLQTSHYPDPSKYCVDFMGKSRPKVSCGDGMPERISCNSSSDCQATCSYGCVNRDWIMGKGDCEAMPSYRCGCVKGYCQVEKTQIIPSPTITGPAADWNTYTDGRIGFSIKYPPALIVTGGGDQTWLSKKKEVTSAEMMDYSGTLVEIRISTSLWRFNQYYNTAENTPIESFNDLKLRNSEIDGYPVAEYSYHEENKEKETKEQEDALKSGASVGMIYFPKGIIINKNGTIIEILTNSYAGEFKNIFDQILSTFRFLDSPPILDSLPDSVSDEPPNIGTYEGVKLGKLFSDSS